MILFLIEIGKYLNIILLAFYTLLSFLAMKRRDDDGRNGLFYLLEAHVYLLFSGGMACLTLSYYDKGDSDMVSKVIMMWAIEMMVMFIYSRVMYHFYPELNRLILVQTLFMMSVGFVVQYRISSQKALRQFAIIAVSLVISVFIPMIVHRLKLIKKFWYVTGIAGAGALIAVFALGAITNGAKLSIKLFGLIFQPSEFVKILFAFFIAGILYEVYNMKRFVIASVCAAVFVMVLVISKDLGMALIFYVMFFSMVYMGTGRFRYVLLGTAGGLAAVVVAYSLFSHVRVRFNTWIDPWTDIDSTGYQLTQSIFAIGTGGWYGRGIGRGLPGTIPEVGEDFVFSAIVEESGALFGMLLILLCLNFCFIMLLLAGRIKDKYYRIVVMGLAVCYGTQVFLTIGGGLRLIPLTGVTLPLISSGGSSALATLCLISVLQGVGLIRMDEIYGVDDEPEIYDETIGGDDLEIAETEDEIEIYDIGENAEEPDDIEDDAEVYDIDADEDIDEEDYDDGYDDEGNDDYDESYDGNEDEYAEGLDEDPDVYESNEPEEDYDDSYEDGDYDPEYEDDTAAPINDDMGFEADGYEDEPEDDDVIVDYEEMPEDMDDIADRDRRKKNNNV
ncbi:MAG: FtsW/RodA/SpoVE family cell cycle protein [Lachnospiraceae bacterium]|nr:FtsW/RodA/SpoVE family cell cycle protein [Lachnospiraceae bacterium]